MAAVVDGDVDLGAGNRRGALPNSVVALPQACHIGVASGLETALCLALGEAVLARQGCVGVDRRGRCRMVVDVSAITANAGNAATSGQ